MFLRLLFVLLAALNIAVGAWLLLGQPYPRGGNPTDSGIPELHLLSETAMPASSAPASVATQASAALTGADQDLEARACLTLGPFATPQDLRAAREALATRVLRMRSRQEQASQNAGWWVYLPPAANHAQTLALARRLEASQITDYYVVSSGEQANTISLGLFKDPANARKRLEQVIAAGFQARMAERSEVAPQYWLDLVVDNRNHFNWAERIHAPNVSSHSASCF